MNLHLSAVSVFALFVVGCQTVPDAIVVAGTGDPSKDVPAVQAAVDAGGAVTLSGRFDFGDRGRVVILRSVAITGTPGTRIQGGFWTFFSPLPETLPPRQPGPQISIQGIHFDGALWMPINIAYASAVTVASNRITNVRPHPYPRPNLPNLQTAQGMMFGSFAAYSDSTKRSYVAGAVTGQVLIEDNIIDLAVRDPLNTLGQGIWGVWTTGIEAHVARNQVSNSPRNGIEMIDNYRGPDGKGKVSIEANIISTPAVGVPVPTPRTPNGIVLGNFLDTTAAVDPARNSKYQAERNRIEVRGRTSIGIAVFSDGAEVRNNEISAAGPESQPIFVSSSNGDITNNVFRGSGANTVSFRPFREMAASGNRVSGNDLRSFKATEAQIALDKGSANNTCAGNEGLEKVADLGANNRCR